MSFSHLFLVQDGEGEEQKSASVKRDLNFRSWQAKRSFPRRPGPARWITNAARDASISNGFGELGERPAPIDPT